MWLYISCSFNFSLLHGGELKERASDLLSLEWVVADFLRRDKFWTWRNLSRNQHFTLNDNFLTELTSTLKNLLLHLKQRIAENFGVTRGLTTKPRSKLEYGNVYVLRHTLFGFALPTHPLPPTPYCPTPDLVTTWSHWFIEVTWDVDKVSHSQTTASQVKVKVKFMTWRPWLVTWPIVPSSAPPPPPITRILFLLFYKTMTAIA